MKGKGPKGTAGPKGTTVTKGGHGDMRKRSGHNKRPKSKPPSKKAKRTDEHRGPKTKLKRLKSEAAAKKAKRTGEHRGPKTEIQMLGSPVLVQMLIRTAVDNNIKPMRKTGRLVRQSTKELLIRLGHNRKEAGQLTDMIMEQMQ